MRDSSWRSALGGCLAIVLAASPAWAFQARGGRGGGARGGGGAVARPAAPAARPAPAAVAPRAPAAVPGNRISGYNGAVTRANVLGNRPAVSRLSNVGGNLAPHGAAWGPNSPYWGYHRSWIRGYWNGQNNPAWGWRNPYWSGWGGGGNGPWLGWGLAGWGFGSALYGLGYSPFMNPYYGSGYGPSGVVATSGAAAPVYDYSQPINTVAPPPETAVADDAMATFDAAREAFKQGNYADAVAKADAALAKLPNDAAIHEFRALCLFALKRYDEAAATLYSVLAVGPGWDWATLISLYPSVDVYTSQLRAAEDYCRANPKSASARFVLAYQYLTEGHTDVAVKTLKDVLALNSNDALAAKLVRQLDPSAQPATVAAAPVSAPPQGASLSGTWKAQPNPDTTIELNAQPDGRFTWKVTRAGKTQDFAGTYAYRDGVLTLTQDNGPVLVGRVNWNDPTHMAFHVVGEGPQDPGLTFAKA